MNLKHYTECYDKLMAQFELLLQGIYGVRTPKDVGIAAEEFMLVHKKEFIYLNISLDSFLSRYYTQGTK